MATCPEIQIERRKVDKSLERRAPGHPKPLPHGTFRSLGLGLITGAADDDPSAIGTYAAAGASFGPSFLWTAPVTFPHDVRGGVVPCAGSWVRLRDRGSSQLSSSITQERSWRFS